MKRSERKGSIEYAPPLAIFALLLSLYLLTYNGLLRSIDELFLFSMVVQTGTLNTPQLLFAPFHNPIAAKSYEPLQAILAAPLYFVAVRWHNVGNIQAAMLLTPFITAITGALVYVLARKLDYSPGVSLLLALLCGVGTMSWPYARSFYREPLVALLNVSIFLCLVSWRKEARPYQLALCLGLFLLSLLAKAVNLVLFLPLLILLPRRRVLAGVGLTGAALSTFLFFFRYGHLASSLLARIPSSWAASPPPLRLYGLLISPGKGLLVFSPVLLLGFLGFPSFWRRSRVEALFIAGAFLVYLALYSLIPVSWHGGVCWGPRYLLPVMPLMLIPGAELLQKREKPWRAFCLLVSGLSVAIQLVASTADWSAYYSQIAGRFPKPEMGLWLRPEKFALSPVVGQFKIWLAGHFDLLWCHLSPSGTIRTDGLLAASLLIPCIFSLLFLGYAFSRGRNARLTGAGSLIVLLLLSMAIIVLLCRGFYSTPGYPGINTEELRQIAALMTGPQPRIIVSLSNEFHHCLFMNFLKGSFVHYWYSPALYRKFYFGLLLSPPLKADRLWLVVDWPHIQPYHDGKGLEWWLNERLYRYTASWVGGYEVFGYLYPPPSMQREKVLYLWEKPLPRREGKYLVNLPLVGMGWKPGEEVGLGEASGRELIALLEFAIDKRKVHRGEPVRLEFVFQKRGPIEENYTLFLHLVSPEGVTINGTDGEPQFGTASTSTWKKGQLIVDRRALIIPENLRPGQYAVEIGFYSPQGRLPVWPRGDSIRLTTIEVLD